MTDNLQLVREMKAYANREHSWVKAQSNLNSTLVFGHGGSVAKPFFTDEDETHAMARYLDGQRSPVFDTTQRDLFYREMKQLELTLSTENYFPFMSHATERREWAFSSPYFKVWWTPTGDFYAGLSQRFKIQILWEQRADEKPEDLLEEFLEEARTAMVGELAYRERYLAEKNEMRARNGLFLYENYWHAKDPMLYAGKG